jgi:hypothetical protein
MRADNLLSSIKRVGTGLSFAIFPIVFVFAFSVHPDLLHPHLLGPSELIARARGAGLLQFGHVLVTLDTALLIVVAIHFMQLLDRAIGLFPGAQFLVRVTPRHIFRNCLRYIPQMQMVEASPYVPRAGDPARDESGDN